MRRQTLFLRTVREARDELAFAVRDLLSWAKRRHGGDTALHPEEFYRTTEHAARVLTDYAYNKVMGDK